MTDVHVSRVLRQLREAGLCSVRGSRVEILNLTDLVAPLVARPNFSVSKPPNGGACVRGKGITP